MSSSTASPVDAKMEEKNVEGKALAGTVSSRAGNGLTGNGAEMRNKNK